MSFQDGATIEPTGLPAVATAGSIKSNTAVTNAVMIQVVRVSYLHASQQLHFAAYVAFAPRDIQSHWRPIHLSQFVQGLLP